METTEGLSDLLVICTGSTVVEEGAERDRWENPQQEQLKYGRGSSLIVGVGGPTTTNKTQGNESQKFPSRST